MPPVSRPYLIRSILSSLVSMSASQLLVLADWLTGSCAEEGLIEQKYVQRDYEEDDYRRYGRGEAVVDERAHNVSVAAEDKQRNERERDAGGEQGDPEQDGRGAALQDAQLLEGLVYVTDARQTGGVEEGGGHDEHARVDGPGDGHGDDHVDQLEAENLALLLFGLAHHPALREGRVQVDDVRHDRGAEYPRRQQHALGPGEPRGKESGEYPICLGLGVEHLEGEGDDDDPDHGRDDGLERPEALALQLEYPESPDGCKQASRKERYPEEQVQSQRSPYKLGQVRSHRYDLGLDPEQERHGLGETCPANLGQVLARGDPQFRRHRLDEHGHEVGGQDHPQQQIPELRPTRDVRREVPRVDVRNRSDERGPEKRQKPANPPSVSLQRLVRGPRRRGLSRKYSFDLFGKLLVTVFHIILFTIVMTYS